MLHCWCNFMNEVSAQIIKWLASFLSAGSEHAGLHLALCVLVLSEILAKVAHQTSYRTMWAAENMLHLQARGTKDIQGRSVKESQMSVFVCFFIPLWNDFDLPFCAPSRVFSPFIKEQGKKVLVLALWISQRNVWITKPCFGHSFTSNLLSNNKTMWL